MALLDEFSGLDQLVGFAGGSSRVGGASDYGDENSGDESELGMTSTGASLPLLRLTRSSALSKSPAPAAKPSSPSASLPSMSFAKASLPSADIPRAPASVAMSPAPLPSLPPAVIHVAPPTSDDSSSTPAAIVQHTISLSTDHPAVRDAVMAVAAQAAQETNLPESHPAIQAHAERLVASTIAASSSPATQLAAASNAQPLTSKTALALPLSSSLRSATLTRTLPQVSAPRAAMPSSAMRLTVSQLSKPLGAPGSSRALALPPSARVSPMAIPTVMKALSSSPSSGMPSSSTPSGGMPSANVPRLPASASSAPRGPMGNGNSPMKGNDMATLQNVKDRQFLQPLGFSEAGVTAAATADVTSKPQGSAFRPIRVVVATAIAEFFEIQDVLIGKASQWVGNTAVPAEVFLPNAVGVSLEMGTAGPGIEITMRVKNFDTATHDFRAAMLGNFFVV